MQVTQLSATVILLAALIVFASCTRSGSSATVEGASEATVETQTDAPVEETDSSLRAANPCARLTKEKVAAALGEPLANVGDFKILSESVCDIEIENQFLVIGSRKEPVSGAISISLTKDGGDQYRLNKELNKNSPPVPDVGDEAFSSQGGLMINALKGDAHLELSITNVSKMPPDAPKKLARQLLD